MDRSYSTLLDFSRFTAAMLVFFHHAEQVLKDKGLSIIASFGHDAVIFFFLLSGFVIGYVADSREKSLFAYFVARIARLYSVAIPSIMLVILLCSIGMTLFPGAYERLSVSDWVSIAAVSAFFLGQSTLFSVSVPTNGPYWSINYEAWYYIIFGAFFYLRGYKRTLFVLLAMVIAGVKILIFLPMWLAGVFCYQHHRKLKLPMLAGYMMVFLSLGFYAWFRGAGVDDALFKWSAEIMGGEQSANTALAFSKRFLPDYVISVVFLVLFAGLYVVREHYQGLLEKLSRPISMVSAYTFTIYLLHFPILIFLANFTTQTAVVVPVCFVVLILLGMQAELGKKSIAEFLTRFAPK